MVELLLGHLLILTPMLVQWLLLLLKPIHGAFPLSNVPIMFQLRLLGRSGANTNLTCVVDCSTDGGYSSYPIDILTDCISSSSSLGMMTSQKSKNVTLAADAHFSLAYQGSAWRGLNSPAVDGLDWSILSSIDLRKRSDGFINTPPVASVASPQYVIVNTTTQIPIPVSDANNGDDVRCRWSIYQQGYRRRRQTQDNEGLHAKYSPLSVDETESIHSRQKRAKGCNDNSCKNSCGKDCDCNCNSCSNTNCANNGNKQCKTDPKCPSLSTVTKTTRTTTSATSVSTSSETPGTLKSTSSFASRQAVDECGGICNPSSTPSGTILSNCTITFTGLVAGAWYAVAVQVFVQFDVFSTYLISFL